MSKGNFTTKKRRLDSEISCTSGVSALSTLTQTTEILNDSDDSQHSEYTDPNPFGPMSPRFDNTAPNFTVPITAPQNTRVLVNNNELPPRNRRISFNLDGDDDLTPTPPIPHHRYDNRRMPPQMMKRNRTRRATESSVTGMGAAEEERLMMHRSNTTSDFHIQQQQQQQQRITSQLIAEDDARRLRETYATRRPTLQTRSQSVNSLRGQENLYTSLQPLPLNTYVSITPDTSNYLHPVTHIEQQIPERIPPHVLDRSDNIIDSASQSSSRYARVDTTVTNPTRTCQEKNYRKGFYLLLGLNMIFILLNCVGLPFVYVTIQDHEIQREEELVNAAFARQQDSQLCIKCNATNIKLKTSKTLGIQVRDDGKCCLPDLDVFLDGIDKKVESKVSSNNKVPVYYHTPIVVLKSNSIDEKRIKWNQKPEIWQHGGNITNDSLFIKVPTEGYYFIYTRVQLKVTAATCGNSCKVGHVVRSDGGKKTLATFKEDVAPHKNESIKHSSHLQFVHFLTEGEDISVELYHEKAQLIHDDPSTFGMFMLSQAESK